ncbi:MFS transporter [Agromyces sp. NPDC058110]|uniref:MFS transporter n=1 Tax=Agromyces sp. NPDC058110 TaxID=3346345 RepID=UPI0036D98E4E
MLVLSLSLWKRVDRRRPAPEAKVAVSSATTAPGRQRDAHVPLRTAIGIPGVKLILGAFFAYCAIESTLILWASSYLVTQRDIDPATAATFAALFLLGITGGRFLSGFFADHVGDRALIRGGFIVVAAGVVLIAMPLPTDVFALAGLVLAGLGCAPIYPAIVHSTPANFGERNSQAIIGIQMAAAYTGSTVMPPVFGVIGAVIGMWILPLYLAVLVALGLLMSEALNRRQRRAAETEAGSVPISSNR